MIQGVRYFNGKTSQILSKSLDGGKGLVWIDVITKDNRELKEIEKKFSIYPRDLEDSIDFQEIPRLSNRKDYSFIVLRSLTQKEHSIPLGIFLNKKFIITVHPKKIKPLDKFFKIVLTKEGEEFFKQGLDFMMYKIISEMDINLHKDLEMFDQLLDKLEDEVLKHKQADINEFFPLKKHLADYKRGLGANQEVIEKLQNKTCPFITDKNYIFLNSLSVEVSQAENMVDFQREKLRGILEIQMSNVSHRLNEIMRSFTVLASLFLLPMAISGIWGMNFANIPFYGHQIGFFIPLVLMVVSMVILFMFFKKRKWLQ